MDIEHTREFLTGRDFTRALAAALEALEKNLDVINAINVYPVPDGDTGTNMYLTVKATCEASSHIEGGSVGQVLQAMARGSLMGARGNSGVILCQFFGGFSLGVEEQDTVNALSLARAFKNASKTAYQAVGEPVEGTMLTVINQAAEEAHRIVDGQEVDVLTVLGAACQGAQRALDQTPELLPVLKQAGVVDAGGQGVVVMLEAMRRCLAGEEPDGVLEAKKVSPVAMGVREEFLGATEGELYGYCTQFLLQGEALDVEGIRSEMTRLASSAVVVGDQRMVQVHIHAQDPGPVFSYAVIRGTVSQVKMENMDEQHQEFLLARRQERRQVAVVVVSWGNGFTEMFRQLGAGVVECNLTMNPSVQELVNAAKEQNAEEVILLPNNSNVIAAAQQTMNLAEELHLCVVETRTLPQGMAALLAFNPERSVQENVEAMGQAARSIQTGEVTRAVRDIEANGIQCEAGQAIALLDGRLVASGEKEMEVVCALLSLAGLEEEGLVTLYYGDEISLEESQKISMEITEGFPGADVEVVYGGQPMYSLVISIE